MPVVVSFCFRFLELLLLAGLSAALHPTITTRNNGPSSFVAADGNQFLVDGKPFNFAGTDAYWLPTLNSTDDVEQTLKAINATGLNVVRLWYLFMICFAFVS